MAGVRFPACRPDSLISIIIPALNEENFIEETIRSAASQEERHEIIVVDGGSSDWTRAVAERHAKVIQSPPGRARQMNAGAHEARGDVLLFLHADTHLPQGALALVRRTVSGSEGGIFRLRFDSPTPLLRFYGFFTRIPTALFAFGDRGLFVRRDVFLSLGCFPEIPLFEDLEMARMLHRRGRFAYLKASVTTSSRRFREHGPLRQQLRNSYLWLHFIFRMNPERIAHLYPYR